MVGKLKRTYMLLLIPAVAGFAVVGLTPELQSRAGRLLAFSKVLAPTVFVLSVVFAVALPIFFRSLFAHRVRFQRSVAEKDFARFERRQLYFISVTPYLALAAYALAFPTFYSAGAFLAALYAAYFYYPSAKRIGFDKRIFKVK